MDKKSPSLDDLFTFKCYNIFYQDFNNKKAYKTLCKRLKSILKDKQTPKAFVNKVSDLVKTKVLPQHVNPINTHKKLWEDCNIKTEWFYKNLTSASTLEIFPTDFYSKPHFLFIYKVFSSEEQTKEKAESVINSMLGVSKKF